MASWQHAQRYLRIGWHGPALASYRKLLKNYRRAELWAELGIAASSDLDFAQACQAFQRAAELSSADAALLVAIGLQNFRLRRLDQARACLQRAVGVDPSSVDARLRLASVLEQSRRLQEAWECVEACLARQPKDGRAAVFQGVFAAWPGLTAEAETALRDLFR